jgi:hypothetical protein
MATEVTIVVRDEFGLDQEHWDQEVADLFRDMDGCTIIEVEVEDV